jgi:N-acetylmuramoyl-L-alanine amidase
MKIIALSAGHGLYTAGKEITLNGYLKTKEWYLNDRINDRVEELLADYECQVVRVGDTTGKKDISLAQRCKIANEIGAICYIATHHNAGINGGKGGGTVVYYYSGSSARKDQAQKLYDSIVSKTKLVGNRSQKVIKYGFYVLKHTNMPAFLIENGFMDSQTDVPIILTQEHAEKTAQGILEFLVKEYSLKKKSSEIGNFTTLKEDCDYLASKGIINSPDYWAKGEDYSSENTIMLIKKFASHLRGRLD